jgi:hypothetical protein
MQTSPQFFYSNQHNPGISAALVFRRIVILILAGLSEQVQH